MTYPVLPRQDLPDEEKDQDWVRDNLRAIASYAAGGDFATLRQHIIDCYRIYRGGFMDSEFEYVTRPLGFDKPARFVNYPLIQPKIELLVGEWLMQPLAFRVWALGAEAARQRHDTVMQMISQALTSPIRREINRRLQFMVFPEDEGEDTDQQLEAIATLLQQEWRSQAEIYMQLGLEYVMQMYGLREQMKLALYDLLICGIAALKVEVVGQDAIFRRVDPRTLIFVPVVGEELLTTTPFIAEDTYMPLNQVLDLYGPELTPKEVHELEERARGIPSLSAQWVRRYSGVPHIRVINAQWYTIRRLTVGGKTLRIPELYQGTLIADKYVVRWGPVRYQVRPSWDNYFRPWYDYAVVMKFSGEGHPLSIVQVLKNIQILYNITMYHIELTMARAGGKALIYDLALKPPNLSVEQLVYYLKEHGITFVNSAQEGAELMGRASSIINTVDLTLSQALTQLINLKIVLEQTADRLTGIHREREGMVRATTTLGATQLAVRQSFAITYPLMALHDTLINRTLNVLANKLRQRWSEVEPEKFYVAESVKYFKMSKEMLQTDFGIFVDSTIASQQKMQNIQEAAIFALRSGQLDILHYIKIANALSPREAERILEQGIAAMRQIQMQMAQQQMQLAAQQAQLQAQTELQKAQIAGQSRVEAARLQGTSRVVSAQIRSQRDEDLARLSHEQRLREQALAAAAATPPPTENTPPTETEETTEIPPENLVY